MLDFKNIYHWVLGINSFFILALPDSIPYAILSLLLVTIYGLIKKELSWNFTKISLLFITLYLVYFIGIFFSIDREHGFKYAEYKSALLILPLFLSIKPTFKINLRSPILGCLFGLVWVAAIGLMHANACYNDHNWLFYCFSSSFISPTHHPTYFSAFLLLGIFMAYYGVQYNWKGFNRLGLIVFTIPALILYILCFSLSGLLFLGLVVGTTVLIKLYLKFSYRKSIAFIAIFCALGIVTISQLPGIRNEIKNGLNSYSEIINDGDAFIEKQTRVEEVSGNNVRLIMWKISLELIVQHPMGVGTGSVDEYLRAKMKKYGLHQMAAKDFNPHNQYLQTTLEIGFIGLLILLSIFFFGLKLAFENKSYLLLLLIGSLMFHSLFESMLQRQSGILFYGFWIPLIAQSLDRRNGMPSKIKKKSDVKLRI